MNRVVWIEEIKDESIVLESLEGTHEVDLGLFEEYLETGKISLESRP